MAPLDSTARKLAADQTPLYRTAPHNIEAEQALLGAILVNNEAFYRVSDFLEARHFFEPVHQKIYDISSQLVRAGKVASPVTLKTFLPADADIGGLTLSQYLARLAAEATTVINAQDYGRTIYDLSVRRALIVIGEDMVNEAYDAPVDFAPAKQIEEAERRLYEVAESGRYEGGFQAFSQALTTAVDMAAKAYQRDGKLSGIATGLHDLDHKMGGLQPSDLIIVAGRPGMGKTALATNIAYNIAKAWQGEVRPDGHITTVNGGIVGFFSLEMSAEQLATRIIAERTGIPSSTIRRGGISEQDFEVIRDVSLELQNMKFFVDETGGLSIAQLVGARAAAEAPARPRPARDRLYSAAVGIEQARTGKPRAGNHRDHHQPEGAGQGTERSRDRAVAIVASGRKPRRQAARSSRTCANPARSNRTPTWCCSSIARNITCRTRSRDRAPRNMPSGRSKCRWCTARPRSSSASSATARPAPCSCSSTAASPASAISRRRTDCRSASGTDRHIFAFGGVLAY